MGIPTMLVVEDNPDHLELTLTILEQNGDSHHIVVARDGQEALELLSAKPYDLIIADWELPGIDGLALLRSVRQRKRNPLQPFILLSVRSDSASVREALRQRLLQGWRDFAALCRGRPFAFHRHFHPHPCGLFARACQRQHERDLARALNAVR